VLKKLWIQFPLRSDVAWLNVLLLAIPVAVAVKIAGGSGMLLFFTSAAAIVPLAGLLGEATDAMAEHTSPVIGGILNATMGNATELIIGVFALMGGHSEVVKASLSGSIIGNLLLVLGLSILVGGLGRVKQEVSVLTSGTNISMLFVAVIALVMPAVYAFAEKDSLAARGAAHMQSLSIATSVVLLALYGLSLLFILKTHAAAFSPEYEPEPGEEEAEPAMSKRRALTVLTTATVLIAFLSEWLVGSIEAVTQSLHMSEFFVGVIIVAIIGNAAEHSTAVLMAHRNKMELVLQVAVGSSTQIALFAAPFLVLVSVLLGKPMTLLFNPFEVAAILLAVVIVHVIAVDGETNWFEGVELLAVYLIMGVVFFFVE
jgi:Ca2+:H+ antiporter